MIVLFPCIYKLIFKMIAIVTPKKIQSHRLCNKGEKQWVFSNVVKPKWLLKFKKQLL